MTTPRWASSRRPLLAALLATVVLRTRNRQYRQAEEEEKIDSDQDGIPDVYQQDGTAR